MSKKKPPKKNPFTPSSDAEQKFLLEALAAAQDKYKAEGRDDSSEMAKLLAVSRFEFVAGLKMLMDLLSALNDNIKEFREYLAETLTEQQVEFCEIQSKVGQNLIRAEEKFVNSGQAICEAMDKIAEASTTFEPVYQTQTALLEAHNESARRILELFETFTKAFADVNAKVDANSNRLDRLLATIERYYGDGKSLEFEN